MDTLPYSILLPHPQHCTFHTGTFSLTASGSIALNMSPADKLLFAAQGFQDFLNQHLNVLWSLSVKDAPKGIRITVSQTEVQPQGYLLSIAPDGIELQSGDAAGAFYGLQTLAQLVKHYGHELPAMTVKDWPDLPNRGVMLDISRDKVPTMDTLRHLIDRLAHWKINELQLYTEHTFAYQGHAEVWAKASPITAEVIRELDIYCQQRFIRLVANQNCFGHMARWFQHERYLALAEAPDGYTTKDGRRITQPGSLCPGDPGSIALVGELLDELLPNFNCDTVNVNCDETFDLGKGRSREICDAQGKGRVYLDFLQQIYQRVNAHGFTMQYWADIVSSYPELIPELPRDAIALEWGYEADHPFDTKCAQFAEHNIPFYVCPGTSGWSSIGGRNDNMRANILNAVENGLKHGAIGLLNTAWGDAGHWQTLPIDFPGLVYGAAVSWSRFPNDRLALETLVSRHVFNDETNISGYVLGELGNSYQWPGVTVPNGNILFWAYAMPADLLTNPSVHDDLKNWLRNGLSVESLRQTQERLQNLKNKLADARMACHDAALICNELELTIDMLSYGASRLLSVIDPDHITPPFEQTPLDARFREVWLARNRSGGLPESLERLHGQRELYEGSQALDILTLFSRRSHA